MGTHSNLSIFVPHAGCPQSCSFCNQHTITGGAAQPAPEDVRRTAAEGAGFLKENCRTAQLAFFGGSFTAIDRGYMCSLLEAAREAVRRYGFDGIRISTRPDAVDAQVLAVLKEYGVRAVELGAQSMCDEVLAANRRGHTSADVENASRLIREAGLELGLQMMTGLYRDTDSRTLETARQLIALKPETVRIYPTVVLRGTELAKLLEAGVYRPQTLEEAVALCAELVPLFEEAGIRVIRLGLHAEPDVERNRLAGAYHPALRELVQSRIFLDRLLPALAASGADTVRVNPRFLSAALGQRKANLAVLAERGFSVRIVPDEGVPRGTFRLGRP